jgi:hypothetical protein
LIDNISTWRSDRAKRDDRDRKAEADGRSNLFHSPVEVHNHNHFHPQQTMTQNTGRTINTGGGDYREISNSGQYSERDINNITQNHSGSGDNVAGNKNTSITHNPSLAETAQLLKTLFADFDLNANSEESTFKEELFYQTPEKQDQIWNWMRSFTEPETRDEAIKASIDILGAMFGMPGVVLAGSLKVGYTALMKARQKQGKLLPGEEINPFDASCFP